MKPTFNHSFLWNLVWKQHQTMVVVVGGVGKDRVGKKKKEGILLTQAFSFPPSSCP